MPQPTAQPVGISQETLQAISRAMANVTMHQRGTAYAARITDRETAMGGKTGTSQVRRISMAERRVGVRRNDDWIDEILANHTGQTPEKIHKDTERDFVLSAEEAKEYGIIDDVISSRQAADLTGPITRAS